MEFRFEKAALCLILALPLAAQDFAAKHQHAKGYCQGMIQITPDGVSYAAFETEPQPNKKAGKPHKWAWKFQDIQQLEISPDSLRVLTIGADRDLLFTGDFKRAYLRLRDRMDPRLVVLFADEQVEPLWTIPVKQLGRVKGTEGELLVGSDRIVYKTAAKDASRTWRYTDIENISTPGPFQLTVTTFEKAKLHYGNYRGFDFQLKEALKQEQYDNLWRRLHQIKGLRIPENKK